MNIFNQPWGAYKNGKLVHAWKISPDAWDIEGKDYDYLKPLSAKEIKRLAAAQVAK